jgi:hypothetical protein
LLRFYFGATLRQRQKAGNSPTSSISDRNWKRSQKTALLPTESRYSSG